MASSCPQFFGSSYGSHVEPEAVERGAEATVYIFPNYVVKERHPKRYRLPPFDMHIRKRRTRREARILSKLNGNGFPAPRLLATTEFCIKMERIYGSRPKITQASARKAAALLAELHKLDIVHNDFTPANLFVKGRRMYVIDFGLAFHTTRVEDKATDVFTALSAFAPYNTAFLKVYATLSDDSRITDQLDAIRKRMRYVKV